MAGPWQRSRGPNCRWRWDARGWQTLKHPCRGWAMHLPTCCSLNASVELKLFSQGWNRIPCPRSHVVCLQPSQQIPLEQGFTGVCNQTLLLLWQKILLPMNIETKSKNLAATRTQPQNFPGGAADGRGRPARQQGPRTSHFSSRVRGTQHHHTQQPHPSPSPPHPLH